MLAQRRKLLQYLRRSDFGAYAKMLSALGLKDRYMKQASQLHTNSPPAASPDLWSLRVLLAPALPVMRALACGSCPIPHNRVHSTQWVLQHPGVTFGKSLLFRVISAICYAGPTHTAEEQWCRGLSVLRALRTARHSRYGGECMKDLGLEPICRDTHNQPQC